MNHPITRRQFLRITALAVAGIGAGSALAQFAAPRQFTHTRALMGTRVSITIIGWDQTAAQNAIDATLNEMARLEARLTRFRATSEVGVLNRVGRVTASPELLRVLTHALTYSHASAGAFDITVAPVLDLYEQNLAAVGGPPSDREIARALELVDYRRVVIAGAKVWLTKPGMSITLDGIAKGFIVDRAVEVLQARGLAEVLVSAGGDLFALGDKNGAAWKIGVADPRKDGAFIATARVANRAVGTSGDYERAFTRDYRFNHLIDPRTGTSPPDACAATVIAPTSMDADALATTAVVLGPRRGLEFLRAMNGEGLIVDKEQRQYRTEGSAGNLH